MFMTTTICYTEAASKKPHQEHKEAEEQVAFLFQKANWLLWDWNGKIPTLAKVDPEILVS